MKTKYWILLLSGLLTVCLGLSVPLLLPGEGAGYVEIISDGQVVKTVDLGKDQQIAVSSHNGGSNTVTVRDGKAGVTAATCPDHYCMDRGMCSGGAQIVCLPNKLVIRFCDVQRVDSVAG